jgi:hypothetical protein
MSVMEQVSVSSLNVKNLKANLHYAKYIASTSNITYFNEIWPKEINLIRDMDDNQQNKKKQILVESDMTSVSKEQPFGGQAWLIDRSFEIVNNKFLNRHVSYIHIKKFNIEFIVIGCCFLYRRGFQC